MGGRHRQRRAIPHIRSDATNATGRLTEAVNSVEDHNWRRTVPVDPTWLNDHLEVQSFQRWEEDETNEESWYLRT